MSGTEETQCDIAVIGGGIIGLTTAYELQERNPKRRIIVLEKEDKLAKHQSGRNSGVIHSGIYYKPGSLKANYCLKGKALLQDFCREHRLPLKISGKLIVAVHDRESPELLRLYEQGRENGIDAQLLTGLELKEYEPHVSGVQAIHVPSAGVVDYALVTERLAEILKARSGRVFLEAELIDVVEQADSQRLITKQGVINAGRVVCCGGLYSDRLLRLFGGEPQYVVMPFRGEFYRLSDPASDFCRSLIYPVPDSRFPFLGVHLTRMITDEVECGPNAVPAFAREGYRRRDISVRDVAESWGYPGVLRLFAKHWRMGLNEIGRSLSKQLFLNAIRRLVPAVSITDLIPTRTGVRAQTVARDGSLVYDFVIERVGRSIHLLNAPSPAATSAFALAKHIADQVESE